MMNDDQSRSGKAISRLHALVNAEPKRARPGGRVLMMMTMAVAAGAIVALAWLRQLPEGNLETLPDAVAQTTPTLVATVAVAEIAEGGEALPSVTEPAMAIAEEAAGRDAQSGTVAGNPLVQSVVAQQGTVPPPTSTPIPTPVPPLASIEAVAAIGGVEVWDGDTGLLVAQVPQGTLLTATAKSEDGKWVHVTLPDGIQGWASIEQMLVFDAERLASQPLLIIPITPTTPGSAPEAIHQTDNETAGAATEELILRPTPAVGDGPTARVTLEDSRLNLRAGPSSSHPIIAKAQPGEVFALLGRDATSQWLQLALPDVAGGFGWAAAEFLSTDAVLADLPVVDAVSDDPAYQEAPSGSAPRDEMAPSPADRQPPWAPDGEGAAPGSAVSMILQPTPAPNPNRPPQQQRHGPGGPGGPGGLRGKLAIQVSWGAEIYIYDLATGDLRLLTGGFDPAFSPDGQQIAFTRAGGEHGLYLINVDGSNERLIFSGRELLRSPKWSPDGQYIVFERGDEVIRCNPVDADDPASACNPGPNLDTERQQKLARVDINGQNYQDIPVLERGRVPDWNSAGIVYQSPAGIQVTQDQPSAQSELVFFNIRKQYELDPDWQPNGGRIVFQRRENDHWEIYSVAVDGSGLTALTFPTFTLVEKLPSSVSPAWSPDGKHIVYLSNRAPNQSADLWNVWVMNADGSNQHPLDIDLPFNYTFVAEQMLDWGR